MVDLGTNLANCTQQSDYNVSETLYRKVVGTLIFVGVWPFIVLDMKWFPISRPAAALTGGTLMVMFTVVPQDQVFLVIGEKGNLQTICLLIGMMLLSYYYDREGLLQTATLWIFGKDKAFKHVLWKVCFCSAILSAIITNDATCLVVTPLLIMEHTQQGRSRAEIPPLLLGIATSANIGSAATFFGNPQNAFIAANAEVSLLTFFVTSLPAAILGMGLSVGLLYLLYLKTIFGISVWQLITRRGQREIIEQNREDAPTANHDGQPRQKTLHRDSRDCSLAISRRDLHLTLDQSGLPRASSLMARERERMYTSYSVAGPSPLPSPKSLGSNLVVQSLPKDYRTNVASEESQGLQLYGTMDDESQHGSCTYQSKQTEKPIRLSLWRGKVSRQRNEEDTESLATQNSSADGRPRMDPLASGGEDGVEEAGLGRTGPRTWQAKLFIGWLAFVTVAVLILLAIPPPPLVTAEFNLGLVPVGAGVMTMLVDTLLNRYSAYEAIVKIDWPVLMMFWGLFIWLQGFQNTGFPSYVFQKLNSLMDLSSVGGLLFFTLFVVVGSNVLSNVPLVILVVAKIDTFHCSSTEDDLCPSRLTGVLLAWVSTIAGNFTLIGSVANLIVAEKGRTCSGYRLGFFEYLRFGLLSTFVVLFVGLPIVYFAGKGIGI